MPQDTDSPRLMAISDIHVGYSENREIVDRLRPGRPGDWLIVAGDIAERWADIEWALGVLRERWPTVVWAPGNHELWTMPEDPPGLRGEARYRRLIEICRNLGVITPEDPYPIWSGEGGPATIAPLFVLYDYSFRDPGTDMRTALAEAERDGVVGTDEMLLHPDPFTGRHEWCRARVAETERKLAGRDPGIPTVLINHFPLTREPTRILRYPQFAMWCGTTLTADWHIRYDAAAVVYGHLHIPRTTWENGVRFEEVSLGYPREWRRYGRRTEWPRQILPAPEAEPV